MPSERIAFFAPLSPMQGGVVDYSEDLLPLLAAHLDIDVFTRDGLQPTNSAVSQRFSIYPHSQFPARDRSARYAQVVYQLGCSADHVPDYEHLMRRAGVVVFHELNLGGIIGARTFSRGNPAGYLASVLENEGASAAARVTWRLARTRQFPSYLAYDLNGKALQCSSAIIVHNRYMASQLAAQLRRRRLGRPVTQVPMGVPIMPAYTASDRQAARRELGLPAAGFVIGAFGVVHESKGIHVVLAALRRLLAVIPQARLVLVGALAGPEWPGRVAALGLTGHVELTGHVALDRFYRYMVATDVCVSLRLPKTGGTSAALLRQMSVGRPVIVSNHAQFEELPDSACLKIGAGPSSEDAVLNQLVALAAQPDQAAQIGAQARQYVIEHHSLAGAASAWARALAAFPLAS